jgi:hypothetical protein
LRHPYDPSDQRLQHNSAGEPVPRCDLSKECGEDSIRRLLRRNQHVVE